MIMADIRPIVRAELKQIEAQLPKGSNSIEIAHFADLHLRIKEALNPTKPIININGNNGAHSLSLFDDNTIFLPSYWNCWPKRDLVK